MLLFVSASFAQELPWECPPVTTPADAEVYRDTYGGAGEAIGLVRAAAEPWLEYECEWVETSYSDGGFGMYESFEERLCDDGVVRIEYRSYEHELMGISDSESLLAVSVPSGEAWTSISIESQGTGSWDKDSSSSWSSLRAEWTGTIEGLPIDGWIEIEDGYGYAGSYNVASRSVRTPRCGWQWGAEDNSYQHEWTESVEAAGHTVEVWYGYDVSCGLFLRYATLDGAFVGVVDRDTWALAPGDADGDGWPAGEADCDDTDPAVATCLDDIPNDGIDQDCDGADAIDADVDGDGHDALSFGGDDCDDTQTHVHPGANDRGGNGVDEDCDGADDIDVDGDSYTLDGDGDADAPDCDDADPDVNPGEREIPYDGVDQDCDGADITDADEDGVDAPEAGGADCDDAAADVHPGAHDKGCDGLDQDCDGVDPCPWDEVADGRGCGGAALLLGLLPLGLRRRR